MKRIAVFYFLFYLAQGIYVPYVSLYFSEKGWDATSIGVVLSTWAFVGIVAQPVMGIINDRLGDPRRLLMLTALLAPVSSLGYIVFNGYAAILAVSVCYAWFQSSGGPLGDTIAVATATREGFAFGSVRLWGALSFAIGTLAGGIVYEWIDYKYGFFGYAGISIAVIFTISLFPKSTAVPQRVTLFRQAKDVVRNGPFLLFVAICLLFTMALAVNSSFLPIYYKQMGFDQRLVGTAFAIAALTEVPMFWAAAKIAARIGRYPVLGIAACCYVVKCALLYAYPQLYLALALQVLDGIAFAFFASMSVEAVEGFAGERNLATYQTLFAAITYGLGGIIGNTAGGIVMDWLGAPFLYGLLSLLSLVSAALFLLYRANGRNLSLNPQP